MTAIADQSAMPLWPAWVWALGVAVLILGWLLALGLCRAAAKPAPSHEYEASPYGPIARFSIHRMCELRGHRYGLSEDGTHWVCVRGDDRVPVETDIDSIENYANGEGVA